MSSRISKCLAVRGHGERERERKRERGREEGRAIVKRVHVRSKLNYRLMFKAFKDVCVLGAATKSDPVVCFLRVSRSH